MLTAKKNLRHNGVNYAPGDRLPEGVATPEQIAGLLERGVVTLEASPGPAMPSQAPTSVADDEAPARRGRGRPTKGGGD